MTKSLHCIISGVVQGVGYRAWVADMANGLDLTGWVRNIEDGKVEALAQGPEKDLELFRTRLYDGSAFSEVKDVKSNWIDYDKTFNTFEMRN